jgi:signal transduction histidine kinase
MFTLRTRLLASYVVVLLITLLLIGLALLVFLRAQPLPTDEVVNRLTGNLLDISLREILRATGWPDDRLFRDRMIAFLDEEAQLRETRMLVVTRAGTVLYDSSDQFGEGARLVETERIPLIAATGLLQVRVYQGRFLNPNGREWIYVAQPLRPALDDLPDTPYLAVAQPVPQPALREVFRVFGDIFFRPLVRAGMLGLLIALGLSALIARSVARPLQKMSQAARRLADGDFGQRVSVAGPREVQTLAESFNEMAARVSATQQAQRDFLANVSHDLRTPLTSIQGFSQAIAEGVASDPEAAQRAAQIIHDEAGRMHRMVEELLDMARIEAGRLDMRRHAVRIGEVLGAVSESLSGKAREKGLHMEVDIPPDLPRIPGDGDRLAQVFTNLIDNAIQHTPPGGRIILHAEPQTNGISVAIRDTGEGIPEADLPRIFERFYQVDKSRQRDQHPGAGLGLAITRQIIMAHGGTIRVASKVGQGTQFTVWLPAPTPDMSTVASRRG